jgi:O-antigen ligase
VTTIAPRAIRDPRRFFLPTAGAMLLALALGASVALLGNPIPVVAIVGGTAILAALMLRPAIATILFLGIFYINLPVVATRVHGVPEIIGIMTPILLMVPVIGYVLIRRQAIVAPPVLALLLAYLFVMMASALFSAEPAATVSWIANFASEGILLYVLVTNAVRTISMLRAVIWTLLVAGIFMGGLSVFQELTGTYENSYLGFAQTKVAPGFEEEEAEEDLHTRPRLGGPIGSKNRYAQVMLVLLPFAVFAFANERSRTLRLLAAIAGVLILAGMALTFSRGAGLAVGGMLGLLVLLRYLRVWHALALIAVMWLTVSLAAPQYVERLGTVANVGSLLSSDGNPADGAILGRASSNLAALGVFSDYPLLGVGPGQYFGRHAQAYAIEIGLRPPETNRRAHNLYFEIAADLGVVGLGTFLAIIAVTIRGLWRCRAYWLSRQPEYANWVTASLISVSGYLMSAAFLHLSYQRYFWLLIALANVTVWVLDRQREQQEPATAVEGFSGG